MGHPALQHGCIDSFRLVVHMEQSYRRQPHDRAVTGGGGVTATRQRLAGPPEAVQRLRRGNANVEATPVHAIVAFPAPAQEPGGKVIRLQPAPGQQGIRQAQRHAGVVGPLPGFQVEGPATHRDGQVLVGIPHLELERGADGVANSQSQQAPHGTVPAGINRAHDRPPD